MPKPKRFSGNELVSILTSFGFTIHSQRGSHVKLRRVTAAGQRQTLTVPRHRELDAGTVRAIFRQATQYIPEDELRPLLFVEGR
jgi:predicted RNA binding protein YcfA (HicA-like mRNA interferase family)